MIMLAFYIGRVLRWGFLDGSVVKNPPAVQEAAWVGKIPWRRKWKPTSAFLPRKSHGQRNVAGYTVHRVASIGHDLVTKPQPPCPNGLEDCLERGKPEGRKTCFTVRERTQAELDKWQWGWKGGDRWQRYS